MEKDIKIVCRHRRQCSDSFIYVKDVCCKSTTLHRSFSEEGMVKQGGVHHYNSKNNRILRETKAPALFVMNCCKSKLHKTKLEALTFHRATVFLLLCGALISAPVYQNKRSEQDTDFDIPQKTSRSGLIYELLKLHFYPLYNESAFPLRRDKSNMSSNINISHDSMSDEMSRLYTLRNFPRYINISLIRLAAAGFYYTGHSAETKCYSCGVIYNDWHSFDNPMAVHRRISPSCTVVQNDVSRIPSSDRYSQQPSCSTSSNTSVTTKDCISATASYISPPVENSVQSRCSSTTGYGRLPLMEGLSSRFANANERNPTSSASNATSLSRNIMSSFNGGHGVDTDTASESQIDNSFVQKSDLPVSNMTKCKNNFRQENPGTCGGISQNTCSGNSPGVNMDQPRYPHYEPYQVRESSFQGWPSYLDQTPRDMAKAGWLYAGYNDYTRCFHCGGGLRNWEAGDDPWVEHARWFPTCGFLRKNKDDGFIKAVLKTQESESQKSSSIQSPQNHSSSNAANDNEDNLVLQTVAARSVIEMGFSNEQVLEAIKQIRNSTGGYNTKSISATDIMNVLLGEDQHTQGAIGEERPAENQLLTEASSAHNDHHENDTESLLEENRQLREQRICKVCLDLEATIAFLPCGHIVCCRDCAPAMRKCPICRAFVKGTVKTFLS